MSAKKGFTLIEVLIALAILAIGLLAIVSMLSTSAKGNAEARKLTRAIRLAETRMEGFLSNGSCDYSGSQDIYSYNCTDTIHAENSSVPNGTVQCKVAISWQSYGKARDIEFKSLRLQE